MLQLKLSSRRSFTSKLCALHLHKEVLHYLQHVLYIKRIHTWSGAEFLGVCGTVPGVGQKWEQHRRDRHVLPVSWEPLPCWLVALHRQRSLMIELLQYVGPHWGPVHCLVVFRDRLIWLGVLCLPSATSNTVYVACLLLGSAMNCNYTEGYALE
jgi:hypothetical protein